MGLQENHKAFDESIDDKKKIEAFDDSVNDDSLYAEDYVMGVIRTGLSKIKDGGKKSVLVIDDLDRLDPTHLFRILNVFSAHLIQDERNDGNLLSFHRVIFVGDYENLISMFQTKFGVNTDSSGYFNKFFSYNIYALDGRERYKDFISDWLSSLKFDTDSPGSIVDKERHYFSKLFPMDELTHILYRFLDKKLLNIRCFETKRETIIKYDNLFTNKSTRYELQGYLAISFLRFLKEIIGSKKALQTMLNQADIGFNKNDWQGLDWLTSHCIASLSLIEVLLDGGFHYGYENDFQIQSSTHEIINCTLSVKNEWGKEYFLANYGGVTVLKESPMYWLNRVFKGLDSAQEI